MSPSPLGLVAGGGELPVFLFSALKGLGHRVAVLGFSGETAENLLREADLHETIAPGEWKKGLDFLRSAGVREAFMAGYVSHTNIFRQSSIESMDAPTSSIIRFLRDRRADTLLKAAALYMRSAGVRLASAMPYLKPLLLPRGTLTRRAPTEAEKKDVAFGMRMARKVAGLDIGQTVIVKNLAVVAVESLEGTDAAIERGGRIGGAGVVVVKVAKPRQDFRFDVPVVGVRTIEGMRAAGAAVLAVEAKKTIALRREEVIGAADAAGISLVAA